MTDPNTDSARQAFQAAYDRASLRDADFETMSGIPVEPVYGEGPYPGQYPYTRGIYPSMYRSRLWTMRMFAGFGAATDTNVRFKEILRNGGTGLSTAFDMPTLMGRDSDHDWSLGEVGRAGVAIDTLADMRDLFADIDLGAVSTSMTINVLSIEDLDLLDGTPVLDIKPFVGEFDERTNVRTGWLEAARVRRERADDRFSD